MTALELLRMAFELGVVACLWLIAARIRGPARDPQGHPTPQPQPTTQEEGNPRMSLSANARRQHGLALVRRTIASGKYSKKDVARWEDEFGADTIKSLLPDAKPAAASKSPSESKE